MLVVMPNALYVEKASLVIGKCFNKSDVNIDWIKKRAAELLKQCNQEKLASEVKDAKGLKLEVFLFP